MTNASSVFRVGAIVFTVFVFFSCVNSQAPAPAPNCNDALLTLSSCLSYVTDSNVTTPDPGCCPSLASLYDNTPICLCELLGTSGDTFGFIINGTRGLILPGVWGVSGADLNLFPRLGRRSRRWFSKAWKEKQKMVSGTCSASRIFCRAPTMMQREMQTWRSKYQ